MIFLLFFVFGLASFLIYLIFSPVLPGEARYAYLFLEGMVYGLLILITRK